MNKLIVAGVIALLAITAIALIGYGYLQQHEINQLNPEPDSSPTPTPTSTPTPAPTPTPSPSEEPTEPVVIPKPSVPEFTVELVDYSYDVPPTYKIDEYTGKTVVDTGGYRVENLTIQITITNQPFSYSSNDTTYHLYYNVRVKGHFGQDWKEKYAWERYATPSTKAKYVSGPIQSDSEHTIVLLSASGYPVDTQLDIQVQAVVGHDSWVFVNDHPLAPYPIGHSEPAVAFDVASNWSSTQTLTIP